MMVFGEDDDRFYISESKIKGAGKGIFASRKILKNEFLSITGVMVERGSQADNCTYFLNCYKFAANAKRIKNLIDIGKYSIIPLGYGALVNHANVQEHQNVEIRYVGDDYAKKSPHAGKAVYWFIKDVEKDEEVLGNYGPGWGKVANFISDSHLSVGNLIPEQSTIKSFRPILSKNEEKVEKNPLEVFLDFDLYNLGDYLR
jgi:hypothetical protein